MAAPVNFRLFPEAQVRAISSLRDEADKEVTGILDVFLAAMANLDRGVAQRFQNIPVADLEPIPRQAQAGEEEEDNDFFDSSATMRGTGIQPAHEYVFAPASIGERGSLQERALKAIYGCCTLLGYAHHEPRPSPEKFQTDYANFFLLGVERPGHAEHAERIREIAENWNRSHLPRYLTLAKTELPHTVARVYQAAQAALVAVSNLLRQQQPQGAEQNRPAAVPMV